MFDKITIIGCGLIGSSILRVVDKKKLSKQITEKIKIPTIGIGSSANCDGQVLVIDDLIGMSESKFKFVKKYVDISKIIEGAVKKYRHEVLEKKFPTLKHSFRN